MTEAQKPYICIEGVIGAGKTTLCSLLADQSDCKLILEEFDENPFLPAFYDDPKRYAFPVELFFMNERINQLTSIFSSGDLFVNYYLADYFFPKTAIFAHENLSKAESRLFKSLYNQLSTKIPSPTTVIYLSRPIEILLQNIKKRGRSYEQSITGDYLRNIDHSYRQYLESVDDYSVIIYEMEEMEINNQKFLAHIKSRIFQEKEDDKEIIKIFDI